MPVEFQYSPIKVILGMIQRHQRGPVLFSLTQLAYSRHVALLRSLAQLLCFACLCVRTLRFTTDFACKLPWWSWRESNPRPDTIHFTSRGVRPAYYHQESRPTSLKLTGRVLPRVWLAALLMAPAALPGWSLVFIFPPHCLAVCRFGKTLDRLTASSGFHCKSLVVAREGSFVLRWISPSPIANLSASHLATRLAAWHAPAVFAFRPHTPGVS